MKQKLLLLFSITLLSFSLSAQFGGFGGGKRTIKGKISGVLVDSISGAPISFATISLKKAGKKKIIDGVLSEGEGNFKFEIKNGKYDVEVSFLGYETKIIPAVETTLKDPDYNMGTISLAPSNYILDAVEVTEKRALVENKVDKIVFNAEDDASIAGGDATEVLRKVPLLAVDLDGNVSMRGSQNVRILINGKPSGMFSSNTADALKMFPADQIKKVEVITSPGAKYDGEGSAGIINIITKKENIEGVAGTVSGSVGTRQNNGNLNLNIGRGRFGFTANGGTYYSIPNDAPNSFNRTEIPSDVVLFSREGVTNTSRLGFNGSVSGFYDFNAYNAINTTVSARGFTFDTDGTYDSFLGGLNIDGSSQSFVNYSGIDWNSDYTRKFEDNDKREFTIATQVTKNIRTSDNFVVEALQDNSTFRNENILNDPDNLELTAQIDYIHPIGSSKLEVGTKAVIRDIDTPSLYYDFNQSTGEYDVLDNNRSNTFIYDQDVYAGYVSLNYFIGKFNLISGVRYERTQINGVGDQSAEEVNNSYDNFLPNFVISRSMANFRTIKLAYSQRIQRPSLDFVNPFLNTTDIGNFSIGNPLVNPELTHQVELSYNTNILGFTVFSSAYYKKTNNIIESLVFNTNSIENLNGSELCAGSTIGSEDERTVTTFCNASTNNSVGINLFTSKSISKLTLRGGGDIYTYNATGMVNNEELSNSQLSYRLFTSGEYSISSTVKADFFGFFQAPRFTLQGQNPSFSIFGVGFRKDFKNASLGIRIIEPFSENKSFDSDITGDGFRQVSRFAIPFRSFGLNFRYKFGKVDFKERKSKIKNTDQKQGENGNGGGGGGGMQQGNN